ncbi:hypothetical protein [Streptomyces sp. AK010]|uniref:hypothetical protein n=1 Tax=Streptomyces sp. AK010 TaxID=2723074 RepID=UPI00160BB1FE|nr:hypothetical protein [Streptomyces sp. AK010]MBB6421047.1 hypothetical protein [Streptomyces sp. AK010]
MGVVKVGFKDNFGTDLVFEGAVEPRGATGYKFAGTVRGNCGLDRSNESFDNTVQVEHGATSGDWNTLEFRITGDPIKVEGEGTRLPNETVDFRIGANVTAMGNYQYGSATTVTAGGPPQEVVAMYTKTDGNENNSYYVRFNGHAWADGPTGYVVRGTLDADTQGGALTQQHATFGHKSASGSWKYETFKTDDGLKDILVRGQRKAGESIRLIVGATSNVANLYNYGNEVTGTLPDTF